MSGRPVDGAEGPWTGRYPLSLPSHAWPPEAPASSRGKPSCSLLGDSVHVPPGECIRLDVDMTESAEARRVLKRGAEAPEGGESMEADLAEGPPKRARPAVPAFGLMQAKPKVKPTPPRANPRLHPQQGELPRWERRQDWDEDCRCRRVEGQDASSSASGVDQSWPGGVGTALEQPRYTNRCRYFWRRRGCKLGAHCDFCHVHPIEPGEEDGSQMVFSIEKQRVTKLGKKERAARKELAWQHVSREHTLVERARRLHAIRTDVAFHHNFGWPVMGAHFAFWSINRMLDQAVKSQQRMADIFGVPKEAFGIWLGVDKMS